jgi:hypothetical protein
VSFRINDREWLLDKPDHNDFERGQTDVYYLPVPETLRIGDIRQLQLAKARDSAAGGWKLGGLRVYLAGAPVYLNDSVERWLQDDDRVFTVRF